MPNLLKRETHRTYTVELDERELGTIITGLWRISFVDMASSAEGIGLPVLQSPETFNTLYSRLLKFATE